MAVARARAEAKAATAQLQAVLAAGRAAEQREEQEQTEEQAEEDSESNLIFPEGFAEDREQEANVVEEVAVDQEWTDAVTEAALNGTAPRSRTTHG